jgi:3-mercaptopyruvate sulfurtransferase SseA
MKRTILVALALILGLAAAFAGAPRAVDVDALAKQVACEEDHVTATELAQWIKDRKPGLRIINVGRASARLPREEVIPLETLTKTHFAPDATIVLVSEGGAHAAQAWVLLRMLGHRNVYFLRGGVAEWNADKTITRYFGSGGGC